MPDHPAKSNIFFLFGEDNYSSFQKLKTWQKGFTEKYGENSFIEVINGKELSQREFLTNIETLPFLAEKRLIIIKDFLNLGKQEDQKKIAENLHKTSDSCILIFYENEMPDKRTSLFQKLKKIGRPEEFPALLPAQLSKSLIQEAKKKKINISPININYLINHSGQNLWTLNNELEKLKNYANSKEISSKMIDELCTPSLSSSIFKLTDAIAAKNEKQSLKVLQILLESGEEIGKIFFMIVRHFRILLQVHDMVQKGETPPSIVKRLKQHPFVIQNTSRQSKNFSSEKLEKIYEELLNTDIRLKTGKIKISTLDNKEFALAIEKFILGCCK